MVQYHRYHHHNVERYEDSQSKTKTLVLDCGNTYKKTRPKIVSLLLLSFLSCSFILAPHMLSSFALSNLYSFVVDVEDSVAIVGVNTSPCYSVPEGIICCDRSSYRSDICFMKGDVRKHSSSNTLFLYSSRNSNSSTNLTSTVLGETGEQKVEVELQHEKIRPYARKWETSIMDNIDELDLISKKEEFSAEHQCDVKHNVPGVFFSTGGYTGNLYHEFNEGILPLYITSQHFKRKVVFVILEYHNWWIMKYGDVLSHLSDYTAIDFAADNRTHCFPAAIVGLKIHDELAIDSSLMVGSKSIQDFHDLLDKAYSPRIKVLLQDKEQEASEVVLEIQKVKEESELKKPKLVFISRNGSRAILNEKSLVELAEDIGFAVSILRPDKTTELAKIYHELNSSNVMVGVHGAAMTHFLFMRPGSVFIQVIPLGITWAADTYYGEPAKKLGLNYIAYQILPRESSLYGEYDIGDPVITDPRSVTKRGWDFTKKVYLDNQNVMLDLRRFRKRLARAYSLASKHHHINLQSQD